MECYICHKLIERHEYTRHVGSHLAGNDTGTHPQPDPTGTLADFSYDTVGYDHHGAVFPAHSTPPRLRARTSLEHDHPLRPATPDDELQSSDLEDFLAQLSADNHGKTRFASPAPDRGRQQETRGRPSQLNAFQMWLKNPTHDFPKYTTIDGQNSKPDLQAQFIQGAGVLRHTTREEIVKIVKEFEGFSCSDKKTCLELVQKAPIFPVG